MEFIKEAMEEDEKQVIFVSDGGCSNERGSFGWVMSIIGLVSATGGGHVPGIPMSSHRAEGFGKLSWLVFIKVFI
jgi:hypothetical protein